MGLDPAAGAEDPLISQAVATKNIVPTDPVDIIAIAVLWSWLENYRPPRPV